MTTRCPQHFRQEKFETEAAEFQTVVYKELKGSNIVSIKIAQLHFVALQLFHMPEFI